MTMLGRIVERVRPAAPVVAGKQASTALLVGWYARKGLIPFVRGLWHGIWFGRASRPLFIGRGVSLQYRQFFRVGKSFYLGDRSRVLALSVNGIVIGDRVTIRENAWIQCASNPHNPGDGLVIGTGTYIGPYSIIGVGGPIKIGEGCQFGAGVTLISENHAVTDEGPSAHDVVRRGIIIGDGTWIGHRATILDGVTLGDGCVVGAGAVVTKSFPAGTTLVGVPAQPVGQSGQARG